MTTTLINDKKIYTLNELCDILSISTATGKNWVHSGLLVPDCMAKKQNPMFTAEYVRSVKNFLSSEEASRLKSRRNKRYISGSNAYSSYIDKDSPNQPALLQLSKLSPSPFTELDLTCLLRHCASLLLEEAKISFAGQLLDDIVSAKEYEDWAALHPAFTEISFHYIPKEDTLGFLYLSLQSMKTRKKSGSYYTPARLAEKLITEHLQEFNDTCSILDPSCGTGCFLLRLPDTVPLCNIHGSDLNPLSITLTRINLAMKYRITTKEELELLYQNICTSDYLLRSRNRTYDIILGNPPWGATLTKEMKTQFRQTYQCAASTTPDSFDLFVEQSIHLLSENGTLSFLLPEAILTVGAHAPVRKLLQQNMRLLSLEYLGEVFENIHCPSIILTLKKNPSPVFSKGAKIITESDTFSIAVERIFYTDSYAFLQNNSEYAVYAKIMSIPTYTTLVDNAVFAMGIVTGNNVAFLTDTPKEGFEPIIKGSDITPYHIAPGSGYIRFQPELFQQTARESVYRAPEKLIYRFINKQLTFAYDASGLLTLNSCNILIPHFKELDMKYVLAILNSSVAQFIFEKSFHSVKVLRSHLEQIPIPLADQTMQTTIIALVDRLLSTDNKSKEYSSTFLALDKMIASLYQLSDEEYSLIQNRSRI